MADDVFGEAEHLWPDEYRQPLDLEAGNQLAVLCGRAELPEGSWCATGDLISLQFAGGGSLSLPLVIRGDVLGTGTMNIGNLCG